MSISHPILCVGFKERVEKEHGADYLVLLTCPEWKDLWLVGVVAVALLFGLATPRRRGNTMDPTIRICKMMRICSCYEAKSAKNGLPLYREGQTSSNKRRTVVAESVEEEFTSCEASVRGSNKRSTRTVSPSIRSLLLRNRIQKAIIYKRNKSISFKLH